MLTFLRDRRQFLFEVVGVHCKDYPPSAVILIAFFKTPMSHAVQVID